MQSVLAAFVVFAILLVFVIHRANRRAMDAMRALARKRWR